MADEFVKGLGIATGAGLAWMVLAGWYNTPGFEDVQLIGENPADPDMFTSAALVLKEALFWFAITAMVVFWVLIPAVRASRTYYAERRAASE